MRRVRWFILTIVCTSLSLAVRNADAAHRLVPRRLHRGVTVHTAQLLRDPKSRAAVARFSAATAANAMAQKRLSELPPPVAPKAAAPKAAPQPTVEAAVAQTKATAAAEELTAAQQALPPLTETQLKALEQVPNDLTPDSNGGDLLAATPMTGTSWQTAVVSGLAQFLAERANEELALWLATEIANKICDTAASAGDWSPRELLPQTCLVVDTKRNDPAALGGLLASAIRSDLEGLPFVVLGNFLKLDNVSISALESLFTQLRQGVAPLPLLAGMATDNDLLNACKGVAAPSTPAVAGSVPACILVAIGDVASAAGDVVNASDSVAPAQISALSASVAASLQGDICAGANCDPAVVTWLGLLSEPTVNASVISALTQFFTDARTLYVEVEGWKKSPAVDTSTQLARAGDVLAGIETLVDDSIAVVEAPFPQNNGQIACPASTPGPTGSSTLTAPSTGGTGSTAGSTAPGSAASTGANAAPGSTTAGSAASSTLVSTPVLCAEVKAIGDGWNNASPIVTAGADALKGQYADAAREVLVFVQDNQSVLKLPPQLVQYLGFAVDVAEAKSANDVKSLLDTAAAPVGSWRLKRQKEFVFSVTSYVGVAGGLEKPLSSQDATGTIQYGNSYYESAGLMASIGADFSFDIGKSWTLGAYLSVLDLGQLMSVPVGNSLGTSSSKPVAGGDISIAQVLSPGAYLRMGFGNSPFVFGIGAAGAPALRKYEHLNDPGSDEVSVLRVQAFFGIDLTLFPIAAAGDGSQANPPEPTAAKTSP